MDDQIRYRKDCATVVALVKYILFIAIGAGLLYVGSRIVIVILPFLIGFVLAKASRHIAEAFIRLGRIIKMKRIKKKRSQLQSSDQTPLVKNHKSFAVNRKAPPRWLTVLFPRLSRRRKTLKVYLSIFIYFLLLAIVLVFMALAIIALIAQLNRIIDNIPDWIGDGNILLRVEAFLVNLSVEHGGLLAPDIVDSAIEYAYNFAQTLTNNIPTFAGSLVRWLFAFVGNLPIMLFFVVVVAMSGVYFITDGKKLLRFFAKNIQSRFFRQKSFRLLDQLSSTLFRVLGGYLSLVMITFFQSLVVFLIAGINYAVILALVTALLDLLPVVGITATMIPLMIYAFVQGNYFAFFVLLIGLIVMQVLRRVIEPPILGNAMNMHPMATLFAMIIGVAVWGMVGFVLGPVTLLIIIESLKVFSFDKKLRDFAGRILNKVGN